MSTIPRRLLLISTRFGGSTSDFKLVYNEIAHAGMLFGCAHLEKSRVCRLVADLNVLRDAKMRRLDIADELKHQDFIVRRVKNVTKV